MWFGIRLSRNVWVGLPWPVALIVFVFYGCLWVILAAVWLLVMVPRGIYLLSNSQARQRRKRRSQGLMHPGTDRVCGSWCRGLAHPVPAHPGGPEPAAAFAAARDYRLHAVKRERRPEAPTLDASRNRRQTTGDVEAAFRNSRVREQLPASPSEGRHLRSAPKHKRQSKRHQSAEDVEAYFRNGWRDHD
jgi:hypothetical protein